MFFRGENHEKSETNRTFGFTFFGIIEYIKV